MARRAETASATSACSCPDLGPVPINTASARSAPSTRAHARHQRAAAVPELGLTSTPPLWPTRPRAGRARVGRSSERHGAQQRRERAAAAPTALGLRRAVAGFRVSRRRRRELVAQQAGTDEGRQERRPHRLVWRSVVTRGRSLSPP